MQNPKRVEWEISQLRLAGRKVKTVNESTFLISTSIPGKKKILVVYPQCYPLKPFTFRDRKEILIEDEVYHRKITIPLEVFYPFEAQWRDVFESGWNPGFHLDPVLCAIEEGNLRVDDFTTLRDKKRKCI
jgi:hypothetical protein